MQRGSRGGLLTAPPEAVGESLGAGIREGTVTATVEGEEDQREHSATDMGLPSSEHLPQWLQDTEERAAPGVG